MLNILQILLTVSGTRNTDIAQHNLASGGSVCLVFNQAVTVAFCPWCSPKRQLRAALIFAQTENPSVTGGLRTVPTIVIAHTFCASRDTRISHGWSILIQGYFCAVQKYAEKSELSK